MMNEESNDKQVVDSVGFASAEMNGDVNPGSAQPANPPLVENTVSRGGPVGGSGTSAQRGFFAFMARHPLPFLVVIPAILIALVCLGWTQDDKVEKDVAKLWIPTSGDYYNDKEYVASLKARGSVNGSETDGQGGVSIFAAIAIGRDGRNLFTASRLEEIRERMEILENTTVEYKGLRFTWDDLCSSNSIGMGTTYKFPCARLSAMDYFQEARWFFDVTDRITWFNALHEQLVKPRVPRYGIMLALCNRSCDHEYRLRTDSDYAEANGYNASYANPLELFADIGDLETNNQCKNCIETMYEEYMSNMTRDTTAIFGLLEDNLRRLAGSEFNQSQKASQLLSKVSELIPQINRSSVEDFYRYYVTRGLYADLGAQTYQNTYNELRSELGVVIEWICPNCSFPNNITLDEAKSALFRHADNNFSSVNTGGNPFPLWNPYTGYLVDLEGIEPEQLGPVGGSGVDMSGGLTEGVPLQSAKYFDLYNKGTAEHKPMYDEPFNPFAGDGDPNFFNIVLHDPVVVWFMAATLPHKSHCGNDIIPADKKDIAKSLMAEFSPMWCTEHNEPFGEDGNRTKQHFAKMWYDLLTYSPEFLNIRQGESDPYTWTTGLGCGYEIAGKRPPYTNQTEDIILRNASMQLYYVDEGENLGALDRHVLIGGANPKIGEYNQSHPLTHVGLIQNIYLTLVPKDIVGRVKNSNRPGGPINNLTIEDAENVLYRFKQSFEETWSHGFDDPNAGEVQMVAFYDDTGAAGSTARILEEITLSSGTLMTVSIVIIVVFSVLFLSSFDVIRSRIFITIIGVALVILSFFAALGLAILIGIKINITIGWTLPFIMIGLGVDDMYIISLALKNQGGYGRSDFSKAMKEVSIPVTMTSLVNFCMFAVMNLSDIPAVYKTAQAAMLSTAFLWLTILFCFPAYCYLDMRRQDAGRVDVLFCFKSSQSKAEPSASAPSATGLVYEKGYKRIIVVDGCARTATHALVWFATAALLAVGIYGSINRQVGLGLEDLFPSKSQAGLWATYRAIYLGSWNIMMNWGELDYGNNRTQLRMIQQFEGVMTSNYVSEMDTDQLWIAPFAFWTTRLCGNNCGHAFGCVGSWERNVLGLRLKSTRKGTCQSGTDGICRRTTDMHQDDLADLELQGRYIPDADAEASWCPVFDGNNEKLQFCIEKWRNCTGGSGGLTVQSITATESPTCSGEFYSSDAMVSPIPVSSGPLMFGINMFTHDDTLEMIKETRAWCDHDEETHCWLTGTPFDYWEQYITVDRLLYQTFGVSIAVGFGVSTVFLFGSIISDQEHPLWNVFAGSLAGAFLIIVTCVLSVVTVIGLSTLAGVSLTAFSAMAFVLSVGFVVEYSVHITHRFITAPMEYKSAKERVEYSMSFLFLPTFMAFVSSTIGVACLAFTEFQFNKVYFFRPLIIVMFATYFFGCFFLPVLLSLVNFDFLKLGHHSDLGVSPKTKDEIKSLDDKPESPQEDSVQENQSINMNFSASEE